MIQVGAESVGQIGLDLVLNKNLFDKQMSGVMSLAKKAGKALSSAFAVKKLADFGNQCLELGSNLSEVQNVVDVTFPHMSEKVNEFAQSAADSFGLSETMAKKFTGTFGSMAKAFGFSEEQAYEMGSALTELSGDVASFYNLTQDEAYTKLKSVFTGETESLKDLGVVMTQTALDSYALANGFGKTTKEMSEAEKVALRFSFVQNQLSAASGDFSRTADGWANQIRVLNLQFDSLKSTLGQGLINLFTPIIKYVNILIGKMASLANSFKEFTELMGGKSSKNNVATNMTGIANAANAAQSAVSGIGDAAVYAAKKAAGLGNLDELNNLSSQSTSSSSATDTSGLNVSGVSNSLNGIETEKITWLDNIVQKLSGNFGNLRDSVSMFTGTINDGLSWAYENVLKPLGSWTMNALVPAIIDTMAQAFITLNDVLIALQPMAEWLWENLLRPLAEWAGDKVVDTLNWLTDALVKLSDWINDHQEAVETFVTIIASFAAAWGLVNGAVVLWNVLAGIATGVTTALGAAWTILTSPITLIVLGIAALIAGIVLLVKNFDKVKEVATKVFNSIWNVIKKVVNGIIGAFEGMINGVINGINFMIRALNKLKFNVPDWVPVIGGSTFGFNLKELKAVSIPRLAEGGYVRANTPQLAMIGDNRHQGEIVSPEDKLEQMALKAAQLASGGRDSELMKQALHLLKEQNELLLGILEKEVGISEKDLFNSVRRSADSYTKRTGNPAFNY